MPTIAPVARRGMMRTVAIMGGTALALALLSACEKRVGVPSSDPSHPEPPGSAAAGDVIMLIRHAEKPVGQMPPLGVTADGSPSDGSLTVAGWTRAGALIALFAPRQGEPSSGLARPTTIWAADPRGDAGQRPQQTVAPLAARLGLTVNIRFGKGQESDLAAALLGGQGVALVAWQHGEIPIIVAHLGSITPSPPTTWPGERFDLVWVFTRTDAGWTFSQVSQRLLAGDRAEIGTSSP